ncbi:MULTISPECIES: MdtA/MuxA family multidrug efflux RND transporter periplasmic adaptor subunit [unclassified Bordetella]|uniref:MdtA/MuxA family multidrug efflux RND transporter periplasmic adaptor subunit n=1 Tax=unclassified Bordetella TaxID=2630031 RepID=UPI00132B3F6C|nr:MULTISPECIES: MdtA/MuxA family multidrug efflux RND transporter periplasmic adaptor subunit [unclassified Bordetella]MVW72448.1 MdtA/MuxA family multidrug efflux RND transporter periplasmic adaptor subunit [Bordetella sp. 15P40C-2]MVW79166.1 MdtA/MuxA family multidrug efflux RND transporter periplasmic adaptor subunit [Bordetella sp. 02P26C-1]
MPESRPDPTRRTITWLVILCMVAAAGAAWWVFYKPKSETAVSAPAGQSRPGGRGAGPRGGAPGMGPGMMADTPVRVAPATTRSLDIILPALGTVTAYNTVTVRSRVDGELISVNFKEGQRVKAGDVLAQIDPRSYEVALAQAEGQQQQNQAQLANARRDLQRYQTLFKQDSIARQQLDTQAALVRQYEGTQKIDQAAVDNAKLQLSYTRVTAPIDGRLGLRKVDPGNLVSAGDTEGLVVITQTQPISVVFSIAETQLPEVLAQVRAGHTLKVQALDRSDEKVIATGELETIDNQIDTTTGTVKLKARFDNADEVLFPNQFVNVRLLVQTRNDATTIPTAAVQQGSAGPFVFLLRDDNTVEVRQVELGPINGDRVGVNKGLVPGDRVVIEGTDRLRTGTKVSVVNNDATIPATPGEALGAGSATRGSRNASGSKAP